MKKLFIQGNGDAVLKDVPDPLLNGNGTLVDVQFALISAGTELEIISSSQSLLKRFFKEKRIRQMALKVVKGGSIKEIIYYFKQFIIKSKGNRRFDMPVPDLKSAGYSCAGIVSESRSGDFKPGDRVACAGANHAEKISVSSRMCVKIPGNVSMEDASFATLGAIALHSVHQAGIQSGDKVGVIGVGLIGLMVVQLAKLSGASVVAFDMIPSRLRMARKFGAVSAVNPLAGVSKARVDELTNGLGLDKVIVAA
nr:zinc-binding alcohol dehydrogenase [Candidatus Sigynarchaeota archaeon]